MPNWWVSQALEIGGAVSLVSWIVWVIGSIILHELGHGWAAIRSGDRTPIETGHMTWNPMVHMGATSLIVFALFGFTWGLMPVNPSRFRGRYDDAIVAAAGPAMNFGLAVACLVLSGVWEGAATGLWFGGNGLPVHFYENVRMFLRVGVIINVMGVMFNLIPVPPLDGSRVLASVFPPFGRLLGHERGQMIALIAFAVLFIFGSRFVWQAVFAVSSAALGFVEGLVIGVTP